MFVLKQFRLYTLRRMNRIQSAPSQIRVAILTSRCGGHEMVGNAVRLAVKDMFPKPVILSDTHKKSKEHLADLLWPLGANGADCYKIAVEKQLFRTVPLAAALGRKVMKWRASWMEARLRNYLQKAKPDLVISVVPFINGALVKAAAANPDKPIPVLVIPTDAANEIYGDNWPSPEIPLGPHCYAIPYSCHEIASRIHPLVDKTVVRSIGYGIRPEYLVDYTEGQKLEFRNEKQIPEGKDPILLMLGGSFGSEANYKYVQAILNQPERLQRQNAHYVVFCARQVEMQDKLKNLLLSKGFVEQHNGQFHHPDTGLSFSILGFIKDDYKYFAIARGIFSKAGSGTWNQAIAQKIPIFLDKTVGCMPWEELNFDLTDQYNLGKRVSTYDQIPDLIEEMMDPATHQGYVDSIQTFKNDRPGQFRFADNIREIATDLLDQAKDAAPIAQPPRPTFLSTIKKIIVFVLKVVLYPLLAIKKFFLETFPQELVQYGFFSAFIRTNLAQNALFRALFKCGPSLEQRRRELLEKGAKPIEELISSTNTFLDAVRIPSAKENPDKKTVVFVLSKHYQNLNPRNYQDMLDEGWDVVLFNPSKTTSKATAEDLKLLIARLKKDHPQTKLALSGYCIGAHVAASVGAELSTEENPIAVIVDRGFGDANEAVENFIGLAKLPPFKRRIKSEYNLSSPETTQKIREFTGKALFLSPKAGKDRLMHCNNHNLTAELHEQFPADKSQYYVLPSTWDKEKEKWVAATHWSGWDERTHTKVRNFLREFFEGIPEPKEEPVIESPEFGGDSPKPPGSPDLLQLVESIA